MQADLAVDNRRADAVGTVYLLHFTAQIGNPANRHGQARHYYGWAAVLMDRITCHTLGNGKSAKIMRYVQGQGIGFVIARTWPGDRTLERQLKRRKDAPKVCPVCRAARQLLRIASTREREAAAAHRTLRASLAREAAWFQATAADILAGRRSVDDFDLESLTGAAFHECRRPQRVNPDGGQP